MTAPTKVASRTQVVTLPPQVFSSKTCLSPLGKLPTPVRGAGDLALSPSSAADYLPGRLVPVTLSPRQVHPCAASLPAGWLGGGGGGSTPSGSPSRTPGSVAKRLSFGSPALRPRATEALEYADGCISNYRGYLDLGELSVEGGFDVLNPSTKMRLLKALCVNGPATVEAMQGIRGGLNGGIWFVRSSSANLVLKLVSGERRIPQHPTECEAFAAMYEAHPSIANDPSVAFPFKVLRLRGGQGYLRQDLIAMERAPGRPLAAVMSDWTRAGRDLEPVFRKVGEVLGVLHGRYGGMQHGDLQTSNIFYEETSSRLTLIDISGMASKTLDDDVSHFEQSLRILEAYYGGHLESWIAAFRQGHAHGRSLRLPPVPRAPPRVRHPAHLTQDAATLSPLKARTESFMILPSPPSLAQSESSREVGSRPSSSRTKDVAAPSLAPTETSEEAKKKASVKSRKVLMKRNSSLASTTSAAATDSGDERPWFESIRKRLFGDEAVEENEEDELDGAVHSKSTILL